MVAAIKKRGLENIEAFHALCAFSHKRVTCAHIPLVAVSRAVAAVFKPWDAVLALVAAVAAFSLAALSWFAILFLSFAAVLRFVAAVSLTSADT